MPRHASQGKAFPIVLLESLRPLLREGLTRDGGGFVAMRPPRTLISERLGLQLVACGLAMLVGDCLLLTEAPCAPEPAPSCNKDPPPAT